MVALVGGTTRRDQLLAAVLEVVRWEGWTAVADAFADFYRRAFWIMLAGVGNQ